MNLDAEALVAQLSKLDDKMHPELKKVFAYLDEHFGDEPCAVIGSAVENYERAKDVDVLLPHSIDWKPAMQKCGLKYNGFDTTNGHLRRANLRIPGVSKNVQLLQVASTPKADDHPHAALLADGTVLKAGKFFDKANAPKHYLPRKKP